MPIVRWLAGMILVVVLASSASAQGALTVGGPVPVVQNVIVTPFPVGSGNPFSLENPEQPIASPINVGNRRFRLTDYLPRLTPRNGRRVIGQSIFPKPDQFPSLNYFRPFRLRRPVPGIPE